MNRKLKILVCPLDWGLGHATRCIPIIRYLLLKNAEVIIASDGRPYELLKKEFPHLELIRFSGYEVTYPSEGSMAIKMLLSVPKILAGIYKEHQALKELIHNKKIDAVISDNRFGSWNKKVYSIFITHQVMIKAPFAEKFLYRINRYFINKYNECWIPDIAGENNFSGDLSHKYPVPANAKYIGLLSRMENKSEYKDLKYDLFIILSGPEPQRTIFEKLIVEQLRNTILKTLVVQGVSEKQERKNISESIEIISHLNSIEMQDAMVASKIILCRSGYSSIMDIAILRKKAIFVPTPGQTEQEYLAGYFMQQGIAYSVSQKDFHLTTAMQESINYKDFPGIKESTYFKKYIDNFLKKLNPS